MTAGSLDINSKINFYDTTTSNSNKRRVYKLSVTILLLILPSHDRFFYKSICSVQSFIIAKYNGRIDSDFADDKLHFVGP